MKTSHNSKTCEVCKRIIEATDKTLRDEFAMAALPVVLHEYIRLEEFKNQDVVIYCYAIADAMLEARKAEEE